MMRRLLPSHFAIIGGLVWFIGHHNELPTTETGKQSREQCSASQDATHTTTTSIVGQTPVSGLFYSYSVNLISLF